MRFWFKSEEEKKRLKRVEPFMKYILEMVEKNSTEVADKATITGSDPRSDDDKKDKKYMFKVASVYSFWKAKYIDHVYIFVRGKFQEFERIDKCIMKLDADDLLYMDKLLLEWL